PDHRGDLVARRGGLLGGTGEGVGELVEHVDPDGGLEPRLVGEVAVDDGLRGAHGGGHLVHGQVGPAAVHGSAGGAAQVGPSLGAVGGPAGRAAIAVGIGDAVHRLRVSGTVSPTNIRSR